MAVQQSTEALEADRIHLWLRVGIAGCFIGHGAFGVLRKEAWLSYFALFGIDAGAAAVLMPLVGAVDIGVGVLALLRPMPALYLYGVLWCLWTALLRPLAGESGWEVAERAGNYGVPLAALVLIGISRLRTAPFARLRSGDADPRALPDVFLVCQWTTALLLAGHAMLALGGKPLLMEQLTAFHLGDNSLFVLGMIELTLALACIGFPSARLFGVVVFWKLFTESLYPLTGAPLWEFIERAGSYIAPVVAARLCVLHVHTASPALARVLVRSASAVLLLLLAPALAAAQTIPVGLSDSLLHELQQGGHLVACRHATTDRTRMDSQRVDFDDVATQRVLSAEGIAQARDIGAAVRALRIPFDAVLASPYERAERSAREMFGTPRIEAALRGEHRSRVETLSLFTATPPSNANRAIVTHQGVIYRIFDVPRGSVGEGDCLIVDVAGDRLDVRARVRPQDWERAAGR